MVWTLKVTTTEIGLVPLQKAVSRDVECGVPIDSE
jgi:hypothetical protein